MSKKFQGEDTGLYSATYAMSIAKAWRDGRLIGGNPQEVAFALLREIERLKDLEVELEEEVRDHLKLKDLCNAQASRLEKLSRFDGRKIQLARDEAEFLVDKCEATGNPQWMQLAADIRHNWGMGAYPAGVPSRLELVHKVCQFIRDNEAAAISVPTTPCQKCPLKVETSYGPGTQACVLRAQELIHIVEEG